MKWEALRTLDVEVVAAEGMRSFLAAAMAVEGKGTRSTDILACP